MYTPKLYVVISHHCVENKTPNYDGVPKTLSCDIHESICLSLRFAKPAAYKPINTTALCEFDSWISQLWDLGIPHTWVGYDCFQFGDADFFVTLMLMEVSSRKCAQKDILQSFESTRNKQQYGTKITCTEVRR